MVLVFCDKGGANLGVPLGRDTVVAALFEPLEVVADGLAVGTGNITLGIGGRYRSALSEVAHFHYLAPVAVGEKVHS